MSKLTDRGRVLAASGIAALALTATACNPLATTTSAQAPAPASAPASVPASAPAADGGVKLVAVNTAQLGPIVTDADGRTLYRFDKDTSNPSASNCAGACASKWPPATVQDKVSLNGVSSGLVGTVTRADGTKQLTLNGWPLYRFAGDTAAGQVNGQGVGGTWFASTPLGAKAQDESQGQSQGGNSGYSSGY
ncbi:putative lipoprotein with Yx(FWY)xxD motif [Streptacidiphilus sp. MAP12-16]|uniref:hypothetical protein n=1 Tax=Streptacidiphilus sp. MAP12-16 TaxID=3156300 RepID=UPI00351386D2